MSVDTESPNEAGCPPVADSGCSDGDLIPDARPKRPRRARVWLSLLVVLGLTWVLAAALYYLQFRPDQQTDDAATRSAVAAASDGAIAVLSYSAGSLDQDFAEAKSHLTGDFLAYYNKFTTESVAPAARRGAMSATASVVQAAVTEMHPDSAVVVLFVNQVATSTDRPAPAVSASAVRATLVKVDGNWLISKFDPI